VSKVPPKIVYFKRPTPSAKAFLVLVERGKDREFSGFSDLDKALQYVDQQEEELSTRCSLYQNIPLEEDEL